VASEREAALAALDEFFHDAMKAAANELDTLFVGKDAPEAVELERVRTAVRMARRVRTEMLKLIDQEFPP
jgi:hypothetical protein